MMLTDIANKNTGGDALVVREGELTSISRENAPGCVDVQIMKALVGYNVDSNREQIFRFNLAIARKRTIT